MATGLRAKMTTNNRAMLGLRGKKKDACWDEVAQINVDKEGERELLGEDNLNSSQDEIDEELLDVDEDELFAEVRDMTPEQLLAIAEVEEQKCYELELERKKREDEKKEEGS